MQLLLYAPSITPRLQYICRFIFKEIMGVECTITANRYEFKNHNGIKINYAAGEISGDGFTINSCGLLFENDIRQQQIVCFETGDYKAFFKTANADFPFDILAASFYLLSRYEEYLPHTKDMYGRYAHENSLAFKQDFLHLPIINTWINNLAEALQKKFPHFCVQHSAFTFLPTYDIDMAFSYRQKGWWRNMGGFIKRPSLKRVKVSLGLENDPFDCYAWLDDLHSRHNLHPLYFFLMAEKNGVYDKNILPRYKAMQKLIRQHAEKYTIGVHPSWQSGDKPAFLQKEKKLLESISRSTIIKSRQHYIRFYLPAGYRLLTENGITDDYSMGYGSINGFRASVASSFFWYDLQKNTATHLRLHPFCFMEANSFYEQKYTADQAHIELMQYYNICKKVNGQLITIWHNNFLGTDPQFTQWGDIYKKFITQINTSA